MLLQFGIPGGVELLVIAVIALIVFGLPLVLIATVGVLWLRSDDDYDERIRELETEIARLQAEIGTDSDDATTTETGSEGTTTDTGTDDPAADGGRESQD
ncbi:hypothetical protein [Halosimplex salinum]|uniref:hypothetical protein n=1 Tax=Halosimplex salinum TaxID=1710538 RepID=UPI0019D291EA|nr:hypothetical protein [Halosimplex salinum]